MTGFGRMSEAEREHRDGLATTIRCAFKGCDESWTGPLAEVRLLAQEHRKAVHPNGGEVELPDRVRQAARRGTREQRPKGYWTKDTVVRELKAYHRDTGSTPDSGHPIAQAARNQFGTFAKALEAAGLERKQRTGPAEERQAPAGAPERRVMVEVDSDPAGAEHVGGASNGSGEASSTARRWTRDEIIAALQVAAEQHGEPPRSHDWERATTDRPSADTVRARFGSWNAAITAAGLEPRVVPAPKAPDAAAETTLVELARTVQKLSGERAILLSRLDGVERELAAAATQLQEAARDAAPFAGSDGA